MGIATAIGLAVGVFLDRRFATTPWCTIIFLLLGITAGFRSLYRIAHSLKKEQERDED